ncbi:MAG: hypothetical protein K0S45_799 [Nitrospira sp.]|nr:hypothetical protein [Nitrospira sp.]
MLVKTLCRFTIEGILLIIVLFRILAKSRVDEAIPQGKTPMAFIGGKP